MKKKIMGILIVLAAVLLVLAAVHLLTREQIPEGAIAVHWGEKTFFISPDQLDSQPISGTLINGKGEEKQVDTLGIPLKAAVEAAGVPLAEVQTVTAAADDAFSAEIHAEELEENRVFLSIEKDGSVTLVVFGDANSKRQVRKVVSLEIR